MTSEMMKAIRIHEYGGPEVLRYEENAPRPTVGRADVLIRVQAAAVNPLDWKLRAGIYPLEPPHTFPWIPGFDVAGIIEEIGPDVQNFTIGDAVYGSPDSGGYAEYAVIPANEVAHKPRSIDFVQAAALPIVGLTAWQGLFDTAALQADQTILIHGAAGGVGSVAVQLAKWRGAQVIATASAHNLAFLRQLGADEVIDYNATRFEEVVKAVDVVYDTVGGETLQRSWTVLKPGGTLLSIVDEPSPEMAAAYGVQAQATVVEPPHGAQLSKLARLVDAGQLKPIVSTILPMQQAHQAHRLIERRHVRGKIVLQVAMA